MAQNPARIWWRLLALAIYALVLAGGFWGGFEIGGARVAARVAPELERLREERDSARAELAEIQSKVTDLQQESAVLERSRQIERETGKSLQDQLKLAQAERLELIQDLSYLKRLVQDGGRGAVKVHDLRVQRGGPPGRFDYNFTITQLIQDFGETRGRVLLELTGSADGKDVVLGLSDLPFAEPRELEMGFEHFQTFSGRLEIPAAFSPRMLTVTIRPASEQIAETSSAFPWDPAPDQSESSTPPGAESN
jgi:hypothetical protein